ncbi:hypothetical protein Y032_0112g317 [Ancylostoma ceylanicum]|uniref:TIL domain-containing protein n=1 Tax=Ancylostoma ceylanicum TaxID=53326 RepID=A0A016TD19_9BILA|nr:hypothetical protein Y032_0112g317 [Ancylostoma ceylanicum]
MHISRSEEGEPNNVMTNACGLNEYFAECGNMKECEHRCNEEENEERDEERITWKRVFDHFNNFKACLIRVCFRPGACVCKDGFYRNRTGSCVEEDDCEYENMEFITFAPEVPICGSNERYSDCGNDKQCERKCNEDDYEKGDEACRSHVCERPGACVCEDGFYRNKKGSCVESDDCEYDNMDFITFAPETSR